MKSGRLAILTIVGLLGASQSVPAVHAQESVAGQEMRESGSAAGQALKNAGQSIEHAYHATADEAHDAALTTKVKAALLKDPETRTFTIHVRSDHGRVTLAGTVDSPATAAHAEQLVAAVTGVQSVNSRLTWHTSEK